MLNKTQGLHKLFLAVFYPIPSSPPLLSLNLAHSSRLLRHLGFVIPSGFACLPTLIFPRGKQSPGLWDPAGPSVGCLLFQQQYVLRVVHFYGTFVYSNKWPGFVNPNYPSGYRQATYIYRYHAGRYVVLSLTRKQSLLHYFICMDSKHNIKRSILFLGSMWCSNTCTWGHSHTWLPHQDSTAAGDALSC